MLWFPKTIEKSRQKWLFAFRLITNIFLTITIILIHINGRTPAFLGYWSNAIVLAMIMSFGLAVAHYKIWPSFLGPGPQIIIQMASDILWATVLIVLTGGCESAIVFLFIIVVINSAFLGGLKISFIAATLSTGAWAAIVDMHYYGYLPGLPPLAESINASELALNIMVNTGASYLVAILGGHLSSQLDISSQALVSSQISLDRLSELNENIIHSIDSGLITTDNADRILSINQAGRDILRVSSGEVIGRPWRFFFPELEHLERIPSKRGHSGDSLEGLRFRHVRQVDQAELVIELNIMSLVDEDNEAWGRLLVLKDRTAMSQMEAEIKRSEHMAAMGELAAGLAHEIRTPLASMTGSWHMLNDQSQLASEDKSRLMLIIGREMERLDLLVNDFLSFARPPAGTPQPINLNELVDDQIRVLGSSRSEEAEFVLNLDPIPQVYFDKGQLTQVIWNLMQNAIEAALPGKKLRMEIRTAMSELRPGCVAMTITDNGRGIPEEHVKHIFEPFYTTKPHGTGLGLSTVWGIIQKGNGHISVRSSPGHETSFTLTLPSTVS
jgi:two-component system sensor histidine kinase PilS (NtrC family)